MKYRVYYTETSLWEVEIDAETPEDAEERFWDTLGEFDAEPSDNGEGGITIDMIK